MADSVHTARSIRQLKKQKLEPSVISVRARDDSSGGQDADYTRRPNILRINADAGRIGEHLRLDTPWTCNKVQCVTHEASHQNESLRTRLNAVRHLSLPGVKSLAEDKSPPAREMGTESRITFRE